MTAQIITWQLWRALFAGRDVPARFGGIPTPETNSWQLWAALALSISVGALVPLAPALIPVYTGLLGYAALHRTRTRIHRLRQQGAYDLLVASPLGPLGTTWACFAAWFHRDPVTVWAWRVYLIVTASIAPFVVLVGLAQTMAGGVIAVALPFMCGIAYIYLEVFLSVSLGGLAALLSASYGLTPLTRVIAEGGYVAFKLVTYALEIGVGYVALTFLPWTWAVGPVAVTVLAGYLALYEWLHRWLWRLLTARTHAAALRPAQLPRW
jgi:hypothetical protein